MLNGRRIVSVLYLLFFPSCMIQGQKEGVVVKRFVFVGRAGELVVPARIFYLGDISVQEIPRLNIIEDSSGRQVFTSILRYCYIDPSSNSCRFYEHFSDTARPSLVFNTLDSIKEYAGWNFYSEKISRYDSFFQMPDTLLLGHPYKRCGFNVQQGKYRYILYLYMDCNSNEPLVSYYKGMKDSLECPVMRVDTYRAESGSLMMYNDVQYMADTLTDEERKVLNAWIREGE